MKGLKIGDAEVFRVEDIAGPIFPAHLLLRGWDPSLVEKHRHWMVPMHYDVPSGALQASIHSWVIRTGHHTIVIDTCVGNDKNRPVANIFHQQKNPYLERFRATGIKPEDVDYVMCTHLHADHVGWNTCLRDGRWVPTFPNAKYIFSRADIEFWRPELKNDIHEFDRIAFDDSVTPIREAGLSIEIDGEYRIGDGLHIRPAPGHTPGASLFHLTSRQQQGLFVGDMLHHPIQIYEPQLSSMSDADPVMASATRRRVLQECAEHGGLLLPCHFAAPHVTRIKATASGLEAVWI